MGLSIDPLFCLGLSPNTPPFYYFTPNDTQFLFFDPNFPAKSSNFKKLCKSQRKVQKEMCYKLPGFCAISHLMTFPFFGSVTQRPLFSNKKNVTDNPLIWCIGKSTPSLLYVRSPGVLLHFLCWYFNLTWSLQQGFIMPAGENCRYVSDAPSPVYY